MRTILLVLDGLGVKNDFSAGTFQTLIRKDEEKFEYIYKHLGFGSNKDKKIKDINVYNRIIKPACNIPDSYLGHREIIGNKIDVKKVFIEYNVNSIYKILKEFGEVEYKNGVFIINEDIVIGNNAECEPGLNINVLAIKKNVDKKIMIKIANKIIYYMVCSRVIIMYGNNISKEKIFNNIRKIDKITYLPIPELDIYNENYKVIHIGKKMSDKNLLDQLQKKEMPVYLIGKTNKMFSEIKNSCKEEYNGVDTQKIFENLFLNMQNKLEESFYFVNIQEIDLFGHQQNFKGSQKTLFCIQENLKNIVYNIKEDDILIITADHGNNPLENGSFHTFENIPLTIISKKKFVFKENFGNSLSDIGMSILKIYYNYLSTDAGNQYFRLEL